MKALLFIIAPIVGTMLGIHLVAQAAPVPKTISHNTPSFQLKAKIHESWTSKQYKMEITATKPIWVAVAQFKEKDLLIRVKPKQTIKLAYPTEDGAIQIDPLNCPVRVISDDEVFEYSAC